MKKSRTALVRAINTHVTKYIDSLNRAKLLIEHAAFERLCVAYNCDGYVHVFLSEGTSEHPNERVDYDIARQRLAAPVSLIYPGVSLPDFVELEECDHAKEKALAQMLAANHVTVPSEPKGDDYGEWEAYFEELIDLLKKSPGTKAMIRARLQEATEWVDYELLLDEAEMAEQFRLI